ncbi:MAG TPA: CHAT domain-containing protein [Candidatus Acidoferrales bacterium]|jgi:CHAT domain-containing protein/Tfp pilus assembly protein PilF|nr:CHAT domain-containing protein [Candidatus Acidoferrales bacterium]
MTNRFKLLLWLPLVCVWFAGCSTIKREAHVFNGNMLGAVGDDAGASRQFQAAFAIDRVHGPDRVISDCQRINWYDNRLNRVEEALDYYQQALAICRAAKDRRGEGAALNGLGAQYSYAAGRREEAIQDLEAALAIRREIKDRGGEGETLQNLGRIYQFLNQYGKAIDYYQQSLAIFRETRNHHFESDILNNLGGLYNVLGQREQALIYFKQALALQPVMGVSIYFHLPGPDLNSLAWCYDNVGGTYESLGQHQKAITSYKRALPLHYLFRDWGAIGWCYNNLGWAYAANGQQREARSSYEKALSLWRSHNNWNGEGCTLCNLGRLYESDGQREKALECYRQSLTLLRAVKDRPSEANTLDTLMGYWKEGKPGLAILYGKQSVNVYQEIRGNLQAMDKTIQKGYLASHESTYRRLADLLISRSRLPEAEQVLNMLKEEEYFEFIRRDSTQTSSLNARAEPTPSEAENLRTGETVTALGLEREALLAKSGRTPAEDRQLAGLEGKLEAANRQFQEQLDRLDTQAGPRGTAQDEIKTVRQAQGLMETLGDLGPGVVALYTVVCEDKYHVILITPDVQKAAEYTIPSADLNRKVMAFRQALCDPATDPRPLAQELYQILVAPVAGDLAGARAETLMWSLDGVLRYLPPAALYDGQHYLVERYHNVVFTPASESRLKDPVSAEWKGLGLGVSKPHGDFLALPGVQEELRGIIREAGVATNRDTILPGTLLLDENFTAATMLASLHQKFPLVHIASHFQFQPGNETASFLLLGDGQHLTLDRIKDLPNVFGGVELLTLSACDTATSGESADGREVEGFAVLAQKQGAKAVLASLWPVADQSTQLLMREFYRRRESHPGMPKAEALRQAQLALLHGDLRGGSPAASRGVSLNQTGPAPFPLNPDAPYAHPYFWSPFILIGNWK